MGGHKQTLQINFLSRFLVISKLLDGLREAPNLCLLMDVSVARTTTPSQAGGIVYNIAKLKQLDRFKKGFVNPVTIAEGYGVIGAKACNDSKIAFMITSNFLHSKLHKSKGANFSRIFPICIAETQLF